MKNYTHHCYEEITIMLEKLKDYISMKNKTHYSHGEIIQIQSICSCSYALRLIIFKNILDKFTKFIYL